MAVVYIHMKPQTKEVYYVGIGNDVKRAYHFGSRSEIWKRHYNKYGILVNVLCADIELNSAKEMEKWLIAYYGKKQLCNRTDGGEGFFGGKHSEESKQKMSAKLKGRITTEETKAKMSASLKGHPNYNLSHTDEAKQKISEAFKGKKRSQYFCQQVKQSKIGYCPSRQAIDNGVQKRKDNASLIEEITTGFIGKIWEIESKFEIDRRAVYYNCQLMKPIAKGMGKGLQFQKITTL